MPLETEEKQLTRLVKAVRDVYFAGHWMADRDCDAQKLWTELRDAAGIAPGNSPKPIERK